jgi:hypothetical protein
MRKLAIPAFALASAVLLASFASPPSAPSRSLVSHDPFQMTMDSAALPVAPTTDTH